MSIDGSGRMAIVLVAGYRHAGKSLVLQHLEQAGYLCVDNLPLRLLPDYLDHQEEGLGGEGKRIAVALDLGVPDPVSGALPELRARLRAEGKACFLVFIGAGDTTLCERAAALRPLEPAGEGRGRRESERLALAGVKAAADLDIDSSWIAPTEVRDRILTLAEGGKPEVRTVVDIGSFGYKYGPAQGDLVVDVRFVPNPYYVAALRPLSGMDRECADYVLSHDCARAALAGLASLATAMEGAYALQGRPRLSIRLGCTGGWHRSVAMAEALGAALGERGLRVSVGHREFGGQAGRAPLAP